MELELKKCAKFDGSVQRLFEILGVEGSFASTRWGSSPAGQDTGTVERCSAKCSVTRVAVLVALTLGDGEVQTDDPSQGAAQQGDGGRDREGEEAERESVQLAWKTVLRRIAEVAKDATSYVGLRRPVFLLVALDFKDPGQRKVWRERLLEWSSDQAWHRGEFVLYVVPELVPGHGGPKEPLERRVELFARQLADEQQFTNRALGRLPIEPDEYLKQVLSQGEGCRENRLARLLVDHLENRSELDAEALEREYPGVAQELKGVLERDESTREELDGVPPLDKLVTKVESLRLTNFRAWVAPEGKPRELTGLGSDVVIFSGSNGLGKSSAFEAMVRVLGAVGLERVIPELCPNKKDESASFADANLLSKLDQEAESWEIELGVQLEDHGSSTFKLVFVKEGDHGSVESSEGMRAYEKGIAADADAHSEDQESTYKEVLGKAMLVRAENVADTLCQERPDNLLEQLRRAHLQGVEALVEGCNRATAELESELEGIRRRQDVLLDRRIAEKLGEFVTYWNEHVQDLIQELTVSDPGTWGHAEPEAFLLPPVEQWMTPGAEGWYRMSEALRKMLPEGFEEKRAGLVFRPEELAAFHERAREAMDDVASYLGRLQSLTREEKQRLKDLEKQRELLVQEHGTHHIEHTYPDLLRLSRGKEDGQLALHEVLRGLVYHRTRWDELEQSVEDMALQGTTEDEQDDGYGLAAFFELGKEMQRIDLGALESLTTRFTQVLLRAQETVRRKQELDDEIGKLRARSRTAWAWDGVTRAWGAFSDEHLSAEQKRLTSSDDWTSLEDRARDVERRLEILQEIVPCLESSLEYGEDGLRQRLEAELFPGSKQESAGWRAEQQHEKDEFARVFAETLGHFPGLARFDQVGVTESGNVVARHGGGRELEWRYFSSGQKGQAALGWLVAQNLALHQLLPHRVLLLDDPCAFFDTGNLAPFAAWIRQLAYASDDETSRRQVFLTTPDEQTTEALVIHLIPPPGRSMKLVQFESWSPDTGPRVTVYEVKPEPSTGKDPSERLQEALEMFLHGEKRR